MRSAILSTDFVSIMSKKSLSSAGKEAGTTKSTALSQEAGVSED